MASVQAVVYGVGLDPTSTTANKSTNKFYPPKAAVQVLTSLTIFLSYSIILHDVTSFPTRILGMLIGIKCLCQLVASFKHDRQIRMHKSEGRSLHHRNTILP